MSLRGTKQSRETISTIKINTLGAEILDEIASFFAMTKSVNLAYKKKKNPQHKRLRITILIIKIITFNPLQKAVLVFSAYQRNYYQIQKVKIACH